jgi:hypothetical protein
VNLNWINGNGNYELVLCTRVASTVAQTSRNGVGPAHLGLSVWGWRQGIQFPPSLVRPRQSIPVGRWRLARQGGDGEELRTKRNLWVAVVWKGPHHRGLVVVREDDGGSTTVMARIGDRQRWTCRRGRTTDTMSHLVLRPKPDAHRMYAQDQGVIHTVRM